MKIDKFIFSAKINVKISTAKFNICFTFAQTTVGYITTDQITQCSDRKI